MDEEINTIKLSLVDMVHSQIVKNNLKIIEKRNSVPFIHCV